MRSTTRASCARTTQNLHSRTPTKLKDNRKYPITDATELGRQVTSISSITPEFKLTNTDSHNLLHFDFDNLTPSAAWHISIYYACCK